MPILNFLCGKITDDTCGGYIIPFYESESVYCRVEVEKTHLRFKTGTSQFGNGTITGCVYFTISES